MSKKVRKKSDTARIKRGAAAASWGLKHIYLEEMMFRIQTYLAIGAIALALLLDLPEFQQLIVIITSMIVLGLEVMNSAIEHLIDFFSKKRNPKIKKIKDTAAAAVLVSSIGAALIGLIIFLPALWKLIAR